MTKLFLNTLLQLNSDYQPYFNRKRNDNDSVLQCLRPETKTTQANPKYWLTEHFTQLTLRSV